MPQSIRDQIQQAILRAKTEGERAMLLLMLQMFDLWSDATESLAAINGQLSSLCRAHQGIQPEVHVAHHGFVERRKRVDDLAEREASEVRVAVKTDILGKVIWSAVTAVAMVIGWAVVTR